MIFSELYGAYYNTVAKVIAEALKGPVSPETVRRLATENAFGESLLQLEPALLHGRWPLLLPDGSTPLRHPPEMPLTTLQMRWLKAISLDPRIRLFPDALPALPDVEPLFTPEDVLVYDSYADSDPFTDPDYVARFRVILDAVKARTPLTLRILPPNGWERFVSMLPDALEYSEKDDKFRVIGRGRKAALTVNLGRITRLFVCEEPFVPALEAAPEKRSVTFIVTDRRSAPERALLHFAHFEKEAAQLDDTHYRITLRYDAADETELVIRVLSFGPSLRVTGPESFVERVRERLERQKNLELS